MSVYPIKKGSSIRIGLKIRVYLIFSVRSTMIRCSRVTMNSRTIPVTNARVNCI